ncbi:hypothetical protein GCM10008955_06590 [Deinococcus malanensis]|uniref:Uncharacterized protein n=1 Tax=Deinococcus malanensis TaxID=1706855 RepID=A0ABQ2ENR3_9DEIO|nr:hypothetical protein GCM10008955_06590 [Deinococcus malanensis]
MALSSWEAMVSASCGPRSRSTSVNSSPPSRATVSLARTVACSRAAMRHGLLRERQGLLRRGLPRVLGPRQQVVYLALRRTGGRQVFL